MNREESARSLRQLGEGYFSLRYGLMFVIFQCGMLALSQSRHNINLFVGENLCALICFLFTYSSLRKIGRALAWSTSVSFVLALISALLPFAWLAVLHNVDPVIWVLVAIPTVMVVKIPIYRLVAAELGRFGICLTVWYGREGDFREAVERYEAGPVAPPVGTYSVADRTEVG